jgi:hypothetical protein
MAESGLKLNKWTLVGKNGYSNANSFLGLVKQKLNGKKIVNDITLI